MIFDEEKEENEKDDDNDNGDDAPGDEYFGFFWIGTTALLKATARYLSDAMEFKTRTLTSGVNWRNWHIETGILVTVIAMWYVNCFVYFLLTHICMMV